MQGGRAKGVVLEDGTIVAADIVVLAAGASSRSIGGLPPDRRPPVRPVKGQMLALRMDAAAPLLTHVLWAPGVYLVPRRDGRLIVGATVEEKGFDDTITAGGMLTLLEAAWRAVPAVEELPIDEIWVGHRPGSRDDAPILGPRSARGLVLCHRPSPQRHFAGAGDGGRHGASHPRRCGRAGDQAVRPRAIFCRRARRSNEDEPPMLEANRSA